MHGGAATLQRLKNSYMRTLTEFLSTGTPPAIRAALTWLAEKMQFARVTATHCILPRMFLSLILPILAASSARLVGGAPGGLARSSEVPEDVAREAGEAAATLDGFLGDITNCMTHVLNATFSDPKLPENMLRQEVARMAQGEMGRLARAFPDAFGKDILPSRQYMSKIIDDAAGGLAKDNLTHVQANMHPRMVNALMAQLHVAAKEKNIHTTVRMLKGWAWAILAEIAGNATSRQKRALDPSNHFWTKKQKKKGIPKNKRDAVRDFYKHDIAGLQARWKAFLDLQLGAGARFFSRKEVKKLQEGKKAGALLVCMEEARNVVTEAAEAWKEDQRAQATKRVQEAKDALEKTNRDLKENPASDKLKARKAKREKTLKNASKWKKKPRHFKDHNMGISVLATYRVPFIPINKSTMPNILRHANELLRPGATSNAPGDSDEANALRRHLPPTLHESFRWGAPSSGSEAAPTQAAAHTPNAEVVPPDLLAEITERAHRLLPEAKVPDFIAEISTPRFLVECESFSSGRGRDQLVKKYTNKLEAFARTRVCWRAYFPCLGLEAPHPGNGWLREYLKSDGITLRIICTKPKNPESPRPSRRRRRRQCDDPSADGVESPAEGDVIVGIDPGSGKPYCCAGFGVHELQPSEQAIFAKAPLFRFSMPASEWVRQSGRTRATNHSNHYYKHICFSLNGGQYTSLRRYCKDTLSRVARHPRTFEEHDRRIEALAPVLHLILAVQRLPAVRRSHTSTTVQRTRTIKRLADKVVAEARNYLGDNGRIFVAFGNGQAGSLLGQGSPRAPHYKILDAFKSDERLCVFVTDEFRTSRQCSLCREKLTGGRHWAEKICKCCNRTWDRDYNGAGNIAKVFWCHAIWKRRPAGFCRPSRPPPPAEEPPPQGTLPPAGSL
uniref:Cas12f1-like TNB domain-containing protein n=1 Tax=Rhizochromulina marina TaxID=1034831 RepID=A0A7S2SHY9_9STRA